MTLKHFSKHQNRPKNKIWKITVKSRNDVKSACFWHVLCHISAIFKDIDLQFCIHIYQPLLSNIMYGFWKILIWAEAVLKRKENGYLFGFFFRNIQNFENPRWQLCNPSNSTSFHISQLIVALTLAPAGVWANLEPAGGLISAPPLKGRLLMLSEWEKKSCHISWTVSHIGVKFGT